MWQVGKENARESKRFRFPVYGGDEKEWPWLALFERREDAITAVERVNDYSRLFEEAKQLRLDKAALEDRLIELEVSILAGEPA